MKFLYAYISVIIIMPNYVFGQRASIGMAHYHIEMEYGAYKNAILVFNDSQSLYIYNKEGIDLQNKLDKSSLDYYSMQNKIGAANIHLSVYDLKGAQIYRNFNNKTISFRVTSMGPMPAFTVDDKWVSINWKIEESMKIINGFKCQKAVGYFRGRKYEVYFDANIPVPYGPWKLFGLPGLIVSAETKSSVLTKTKSLQWKVILEDVCFPCDTNFVICKPYEPKNKTLREYVSYSDFISDSMINIVRAKLPPGLKINKIPTAKPPSLNRIYPLERKYEWEKKTSVKNKKHVQLQIESVKG